MTRLTMRAGGLVVGALIALSPVGFNMSLVGDVTCGPALFAAVGGYIDASTFTAGSSTSSSGDLQRAVDLRCNQAGIWRSFFGVLVAGGALIIAPSLPRSSAGDEERRQFTRLPPPPAASS